MANALEQLKQFTTVVADTGDIDGENIIIMITLSLSMSMYCILQIHYILSIFYNCLM